MRTSRLNWHDHFPNFAKVAEPSAPSLDLIGNPAFLESPAAGRSYPGPSGTPSLFSISLAADWSRIRVRCRRLRKPSRSRSLLMEKW